MAPANWLKLRAKKADFGRSRSTLQEVSKTRNPALALGNSWVGGPNPPTNLAEGEGWVDILFWIPKRFVSFSRVVFNEPAGLVYTNKTNERGGNVLFHP